MRRGRPSRHHGSVGLRPGLPRKAVVADVGSWRSARGRSSAGPADRGIELELALPRSPGLRLAEDSGHDLVLTFQESTSRAAPPRTSCRASRALQAAADLLVLVGVVVAAFPTSAPRAVAVARRSPGPAGNRTSRPVALGVNVGRRRPAVVDAGEEQRDSDRSFGPSRIGWHLPGGRLGLRSRIPPWYHGRGICPSPHRDGPSPVGSRLALLRLSGSSPPRPARRDPVVSLLSPTCARARCRGPGRSSSAPRQPLLPAG